MATVNSGVCLEDMFRGLHGRLRSIAVWSGTLWCVAAGLALLLLIGLIDWRWHIDLPQHRQMLLAIAGVVWGTLLFGLVIRPARHRYRATETALRIEQLRPHWRGALVSSVEFASFGCRPDDGAPSLQQMLIERTQSAITDEDWQPLVSRRRLRMAGVCAGLLTLIAAILSLISPANAGLALNRMLTPHSAPGWPREHTLVLLDSTFQPIDHRQPFRPAPLGERLLIYVDDAASQLPEEVTLYISDGDGRRQSHSLERATISDSDGRRREIGVMMLPADSSRIEVRAVGGDDERMPWHKFEFVPRPNVHRFHVTLTPPDYLQQPATEMVTSSGDFAALVGTRVRLEAELDRPVRNAVFEQTGLPPNSERLSDDGRRLTVEFVIPATSGGSYAIDLVSRDGMRNPDAPRHRVEGIADREPTVALTQPAADMTVTPQAVIPLRIEAADDLGLVDVRLSVAQPPGSADEQSRPLALETPLAREATFDVDATPADLNLQPGGRMLLRAEATDAWNLEGRHLVRSVPRTLSVVTPDEKLRELIGRQAGIAQLLEASAERQSRTLQQTRGLQLQWQTATRWSPTDVDSFRRMAHEQTQLVASLCDEQRGAVPQSQGILQELSWNRLDDEATVQRLTLLNAELHRLDTEIGPALEQAVNQAARTASQSGDAAPSGTAVSDLLNHVERTQTAAHELLDEMAELFSDWLRQHDLNRSLAEIVAEQTSLNRETRELGRRTLATPLDELAEDDRSALAQIGQRQQQAADAVQRFHDHLQAMSNREPSAPQADEFTVPDARRALELLDDGALAAEMERAAQLVARNEITESASSQQEIAEALTQLEQAVHGLDASLPDTLIRQIEKALSDGEALQDRQEQLLGETAAGIDGEQADQLRRRQQELADDADRWAARLRRQQLESSAEIASKAAASMRSAADQLLAETADPATEQQTAAIEQLEQAQSALADARRRLEFDSTFQEWARIASLLDAFAERQTQLIGETSRLMEEQSRRQSLSRSQMRSLLALGTAQSQLATDVAQLRDSPEGEAIVREALVATIEQMQTAAERLAERNLDEVTRVAQQAALDQLRALSSDLNTQPTSDASEASPDPSTETPPDPGSWPLATQLKVLVRLQSDIARQSTEIRTALPEDQIATAEQRAALQQLAERQSRLAELLEQLLSNPDEVVPAEQ